MSTELIHVRFKLTLLWGMLLVSSPLRVHAQEANIAHHGRVRVHFIAAEEVEWDYAPSGQDEAMGHPFDEFEKHYMVAGPHQIGRVYKKCVFREYTDAKFNHVLPRSPEEQYLGILGPTLYAEVGDTLKIVFKNRAEGDRRDEPHAERW